MADLFIGSRQTGKTTRLIELAVDKLLCGENVVFLHERGYTGTEQLMTAFWSRLTNRGLHLTRAPSGYIGIHHSGKHWRRVRNALRIRTIEQTEQLAGYGPCSVFADGFNARIATLQNRIGELRAWALYSEDDVTVLKQRFDKLP